MGAITHLQATRAILVTLTLVPSPDSLSGLAMMVVRKEEAEEGANVMAVGLGWRWGGGTGEREIQG